MSTVYKMHQHLFSFGQDFSIETADGTELEATDSIANHGYRILRGGAPIAAVSQRWFSIPQSFGVEIDDGEDDALLLAITVCIDEMIEPERSR